MTPIRSAWRRRPVAGAAVLAMTAGLLAAAGTTGAPPSEALTPPVSFTADELPTWQTNGIVWDLAQAEGTVFAGGTFSTVRPPGSEPGTDEEDAVNFVALDGATGEPVPDCTLSFTNSQGAATVRALEVSPDGGTLFVGGGFSAVNGHGVANIAAIDLADCTPQHFPLHVSATVRALAVTDDTVYLGGDFNSAGGETRQRFAAADHSGGLLPFTANADELGRAIEVTPDGANVVLGGYFFTMNGADSHALAVVDAETGENVQEYPLGFIEERSVVHGLAVDEDGFYTAHEGTGHGVFDGRIALDLDTFEERWRDTCLGATQDLTVYEEVLYSAHHAHDCAEMGEFPDGPRFRFFAQEVDDPALLGWFPDTDNGLGEGVGPRALQVVDDHPDDERDFLWSGGEFTRVNDTAQWGLTRFATAPDTGDPTRPEAHAFSHTPGEVEVTWRASLDTDDSLLTYHVYRDDAAEPIHTVQGDSVPWRRPQLSFTDTDVSPGDEHSYRVTATDGAGNTSAASHPAQATTAGAEQPYVAEVLADDPELYWRFDEEHSFFAADASGNGHNGAHRGNPGHGAVPPAVDGPDATGTGYTGSDDTYTHSDHAFDAPESFSLETWFRTDTDQGGKLIGFGSNIWRLSTSFDKQVYMMNGGRLTFGVNDGERRVLSTPDSYNDGEWHHLVATQDADGMRIYVDGELQASNSVSANQSFTGYWRVGGDNLANWPAEPHNNGFAGDLDEVAVYHHALSADRVSAHHDAAREAAPVVTSVTPSADTYVNEHAPGTAHGTSTKLASRGEPGYETYLRFEAPEAPAGTALQGAALNLTLTDDDYAGSADPHWVVPVTGEWDEAGTTWRDRPSLGDEVLGTVEGATQPERRYSTPLETAAVDASLGGTLDVGLHSAGDDNLFFWSREAGAANRPTLQLTFGAP